MGRQGEEFAPFKHTFGNKAAVSLIFIDWVLLFPVISAEPIIRTK
jgi:hypothetical protein